MRYTLAKLEQKTNEEVYRIYVAECLQAIASNTAPICHHYGGDGMILNRSYRDILKREPKDERDGDEIAADVIKKAGLKVVGMDGSI